MRSLAKLNQSTDFQAVAGCNRTMLEIVVDMILLHHDKTTHSAYWMEQWELSAKLQVAECLINYFRRMGQPVPPEHKAEKEFVQQNQASIRTQRFSLWPSCKGRHPSRWTGQANLLSDIREADRLQGTKLEEFYETRYRQICWDIHGSGLASVRGLQKSSFDAKCGLAYKACGDFAMLCTHINF
jgi:hypothetical protein